MVDMQSAHAMFSNVGSSGFTSSQNNLAVEFGLDVQGTYYNAAMNAEHGRMDENSYGRANETEEKSVERLKEQLD